MQPGSLRNAYLDALGIDRWVPRQRAGRNHCRADAHGRASPRWRARRCRPPCARPMRRRRAVELAGDWGALREQVAACTACELCKTRTQTVFGVGNTRAEWLVIGEAPGADEDRQGEPFVGRAGQLLNAMLLAIGLPRETVFIANILKCRPPGNRDPKPEEVSRCLPFLSQQIALLKPKIMLAVGRIAAQNLLATDAPLARLRGKLHHFGEANTPLVVTYHPAYLLRTPADKRKAWEDLKFARATYRASLGTDSMAAAPEDLREVPEVHIRPMMEIDLPDVAGIEQQSYAFPWSENIFRDCLRVGYTCRALDLAGQIIGYGVMSLGAGEAHILNVCVRDEFRSLGFGARLLEHLLERAAAAGSPRPFSRCGRPIWRPSGCTRSLGFEQIGIRRGYYQAPDGREDAIVLKLELSAAGKTFQPETFDDFDRAGNGAPAHVRHHFAPRRGQDHAHREAAAVRRRHPDGGHRQGPQGRAPCHLRLDGAGEAARHFHHLLGDAVPVPRPASSTCSTRPATRISPRTRIARSRRWIARSWSSTAPRVSKSEPSS